MSASASEIEQLARKRWGEPNSQHSTRDELRFGTHGSKSVKLKERTWYDHEAGEGGGYADLYEKVHGERPADASIIAAYDYHDVVGRLVFQVVRKVPKKFVQRRPDANGGWIWDRRGVELVLYRLPELLRAAPDAPVFICEGEKDCDALHERGLIATTNPGGAGKWHPDLSKHFQARNVVILADNDPQATTPDGTPRWHPDGRPVLPGQDHAADVAAKLWGIAASVHVVMLPDLPPKGDVSDWLAAGGTAEELERIAAEHLRGDAEARPEQKTEGAPELRSILTIEAWADRDIPPPDRLLGDLITTTSRMFIVGRTGLGKTMFGFALGAGLAAGTGFLHWRSARPARVLIIDGEMPGELIKARSIDALRRASVPPKPGFLTIYSRDMEEEIGRGFPKFGTLAPLNTEAGQNFVRTLIDELGGLDVVIFDNVMSLVSGDMKDEIPWSETLPLVTSLTAKRIGQVWLDHTGHNTDRQYGSATKAWRFDAVGLMTPLAEGQLDRGAVGFSLSFEPPGKARRRTPDNWADFETCTIRLHEDQWSSDRSEAVQTKPKEARLSDKPAVMLREARKLLGSHGVLVQPETSAATVRAVSRQVLRKGLITSGWFPEDLLRTAPQSEPELTRPGYRPESHALTTLKRNGFLTFNRDWVWVP